jgi:P27 family predicted phage terminase small subunit
MRGRKPKATAVKKAAGNPGKRKLNENEPEFSGEVGEPPSELDDLAQSEWIRLAKLFEPHGVLKATDRGVLALYCVAVSTWFRARQEMLDEGEVLEDVKGRRYPNPWVRIARDAAAEMARFGACLGLDPTTRTRLVAEAAASLPMKPHVPARPATKLDSQPLPP